MVSTRSMKTTLSTGLVQTPKSRGPMTEAQKAKRKATAKATEEAKGVAKVAAKAAREAKGLEWLRNKLRQNLMEMQEGAEKAVEKQMKCLTLKKERVKQPKSGGFGSPVVWGQSTQVVEDAAAGGDEHPYLLDENGWVLGVQDGEFLTADDGIQLPCWA